MAGKKKTNGNDANLGRGNTVNFTSFDDLTNQEPWRQMNRDEVEGFLGNLQHECDSRDKIMDMLTDYTIKTLGMDPEHGEWLASDWLKEATENPDNLIRTDVTNVEWFSSDPKGYRTKLTFADGTSAMSWLNAGVWEAWYKFAKSGHKAYPALMKYAHSQSRLMSAQQNDGETEAPPAAKSNKGKKSKKKSAKANPILNNALNNAEQVRDQAIEDMDKLIENEDDPLGGMTMEKMNMLMKNVREMLGVMQSNWDASKKEFNLTDELMRQVYQYNEEHMTPMPDNLTEEERQNWDHFNSIDNMPEEEIVRIFGEDHPIIGVHIDQTRDRIKSVIEDFFNWLSAMREYSNIEIAYRQLLEAQEDNEMEKLKVLMQNESDPEKKANMQAALDYYDSIKYMDFLKEELDPGTVERLVNAWGDTKKIEYWLKRTRDKLSTLKISQQFVLEISQFEKRYLPERYHEMSNMMLLYFMSLTVYANVGDPKSKERSKIIAMVMAFDNTIRNIFDEPTKKRVLDNITAFLEQLINPIYAKYYPDQNIPVIKAEEVAPTDEAEADEFAHKKFSELTDEEWVRSLDDARPPKDSTEGDEQL